MYKKKIEKAMFINLRRKKYRKTAPGGNQERLNIYPKIYAFSTDILYHLRAATASGTTVLRWLLFLYPFLHIDLRGR